MTQIPEPYASNESTDSDDLVGSTDRSVSTDSFGGDVINVLRGFCMGAADTVPGVSGGTVALILGHYDRLIAAISHVDSEAVAMLIGGRWKDLFQKLDLRFLIALGIGIVTGIGLLAGLMHFLLHERMNQTMAVFFGLILASVWVVRRNVTSWSLTRWVAVAIGIAVALAISRIPMAVGSVGLPYLFLSASIAICAMILPGISGAFVLLLLGVYEPVIGMIKDTVKGDWSIDTFTHLGVFAIGCGFGLLAFSRLLNYLLATHRDTTMAALIGLMIGSVGRLWPLQVVTPETADLKLKFQEFMLVSPANYDGNVWLLLALAVVAAAVVLVTDACVYESKVSTSRNIKSA